MLIIFKLLLKIIKVGVDFLNEEFFIFVKNFGNCILLFKLVDWKVLFLIFVIGILWILFGIINVLVILEFLYR